MNESVGRLRSIIGGTVGFAAVWVFAAGISPTTTFHLAPAVVGAWPAVAARSRTDRPWALSAGPAIALAVTLGLSVAGLLRGPSLVASVGPAVESAMGAGLGGLVGFVAMQLKTRSAAGA